MRSATWVLFLWLIYVYFAGLFYFYKGFLLTKHEIHNVNSCPSSSDCFVPSSYSKVVILLIDALRHDFVENVKENNHRLPIYMNKMSFVNSLLVQKPAHTRLYEFVADPPTTTLQRLKALSTGSLPTFIDASSNFGAESLSEDNWIHQLTSQNKSTVFMGDDTWLSLFPSQFKRSYPYSSFDVWDLDTVDNGVRNTLSQEFEIKDWDVLIAHCLGVDHCGHRYGPNHPEMQRKLNEMDDLIRYITENIDNNTLLLVLGDHGMTETGDHGGDSRDEVAAALFAYSPVPLSASLLPTSSSISQIDLVSTISLLLGIPIPYSNLGRPILELFQSPNAEPGFLQSQALYITVQQVWSYLETYSQQAQPFDSQQYEAVIKLHALISSKWARSGNDSQALKRVATLMNDFLRLAKEMCTQVWVHFNLRDIALGLAHLLGAVIGNVWAISHASDLLALDSATEAVPLRFRAFTVLLSWIALALSATNAWPVNWAIQLLLSLAGSCLIFCRHRLPRSAFIGNQIRSWLPSNGLTTAISLLLVASFATFFSNSLVVQEPYVAHYLLQSLLWLTFILNPQGKLRHYGLPRIALASLAARIALPYFRCREEQFPGCVVHNAHRTLSVLPADATLWLRYSSACLACLGALFCLRGITKAWKYFAGLGALIVSHWTVEFFLGQVPSTNLLLIPQLFYVTWALGIAYYSLKYVFTKSDKVNFLVNLLSFATTMALLLAGDGFALPILTIPLIAALGFKTLTTSSVFLAFLAIYGFFATGHHTNFASIPWEVAFVGRRHGSNSSTLYPVLMVLFSSFFSLVFCALALPLSVLLHPAKHNNSSRKETIQVVAQAVLRYVLIQGIRLFCASLAAFVLRRHLMVWKIFAPRWIYEGLAFLITVLFITISSAVALTSWQSLRTSDTVRPNKNRSIH